MVFEINSSCAEVQMRDESSPFERPTAIESLFGKALVALLRLGVGPSHMRVLEVRGRKSRATYMLPVDPLEHDGKLYLVAPRGRTQWARNVEAAGEIVLRRGRSAGTYRVRALSDGEKPAVLKAYLDSFRSEVQRFFPLAAGSPVGGFVQISSRYPVFELARR